jgi:hypothetical protein
MLKGFTIPRGGTEPPFYAMQHLKAHLHDEAGTAALGAALARALQPGL